MFCQKCGTKLADDAKFCPACGAEVNKQQPQESPKISVPVPQWEASDESEDVSPKSRLAAALLAFFLGWLGIHRFYVGKIGTGILIILLSWCFIGEIWALIDFILILCGVFKDKQRRVISDWDF